MVSCWTAESCLHITLPSSCSHRMRGSRSFIPTFRRFRLMIPGGMPGTECRIDSPLYAAYRASETSGTGSCGCRFDPEHADRDAPSAACRTGLQVRQVGGGSVWQSTCARQCVRSPEGDAVSVDPDFLRHMDVPPCSATASTEHEEPWRSHIEALAPITRSNQPPNAAAELARDVSGRVMTLPD